MTVTVIGASPVSFVSEDVGGNAGRQYEIPLPLLLNASGTIDATAWVGYTTLAATDQTVLTNLVNSLVAQGILTTRSS